MLRTTGWILAMLALLATGALGIYNGLTEWGDATTGWQRAVTGGVVVYGVLGLLGGIGLARRRRWSYRLAIAWGFVVTFVASGAVLAYGGADASVGAAVSAGIGAAVVGILVALAARAATHRRPVLDGG
jgi:hypothetical protein